jgi:putative endonuclease
MILYTGVTSNLRGRVKEHKENKHPGSFTARYNIRKLVYFESFDSIVEAIKREKQIKAGSRKKKLYLINSSNPEWMDLYFNLQVHQDCRVPQSGTRNDSVSKIICGWKRNRIK